MTSGQTQPAPTTLSDGIRVLAHEQSAAEAYAVILDTHGKKDMDRYVQGIRLYAEAKSEFDGLIGQLKLVLSESRNFDDPNFARTVEAAANKRIEFATFLVKEIVANIQGARVGFPSVLMSVPELTETLFDACKRIGNGYTMSDQEHRDAIHRQLERLKWHSFADISRH